MTSKEYLQQIRRIDTLINRKREELIHLRELGDISAMDYEKERVTSSPVQDSMANIVCKIVDLENEINQDIKEYLEIKQEVIRTIDSLEEPELIDLLYRRYVRFEKWEKIAYKMNYSLRGIHKLHGKALIAIDLLINERVHLSSQ